MNNVKNIIIPHPAHHHTVKTPVQSTHNPPIHNRAAIRIARTSICQKCLTQYLQTAAYISPVSKLKPKGLKQANYELPFTTTCTSTQYAYLTYILSKTYPPTLTIFFNSASRWLAFSV